MAVTEQSDHIRNRALAAALVANDRNKFLSEQNIFVAKPGTVLFLLVSSAVNMQRFDVARAVLPDLALGLRLGTDVDAILRLKDDLLETFIGEICLDPCRFQDDPVPGSRKDLPEFRIEIGKGMGIATGQYWFGFRVFLLFLRAVGFKEIRHVPGIAEERVAKFVQFVRYLRLPFDTRLCPDAVIVRCGDDQDVLKEISISPVSLSESSSNIFACGRCRLEIGGSRKLGLP